MLSQLGAWQSALPTIKPFYAVKCNPDPTLMTWLAEGGAGFDCASAREMKVVSELYTPTVKLPEIVFANPCKKGDEIFYSGRKVNTTVVDSEEELKKLAQKGWIGNSLVRIRVGDSGSRMPFGAKFGAELESVAALAAAATKIGQRLSGISFHVGSGCGNPVQYADAIRAAEYARILLQKAGHTPTTLDIGGGFTEDGFQNAAAMIRHSIRSLQPGLRVIAEPGRFFAASCQDLFVKVIAKKPAARGRTGWRYTIDDSLYGQFSCIPYDQSTPRWIRVRGPNESERPRSAAILYGRTCDSVDMIAAAASTEELEVDDWLWFPNMGAYTSVTSTEFNGFPKPRALTLEAHRPEQLPSPKEFLEASWPSGLRYVSAVQVPQDL